jgi:hypothetical protein
MNKKTLFESSLEFRPVWDNLPAGTIAWKVKTFDGNTGNCVSIEYTLDKSDLADMRTVACGYFTETYKLTK